MRKHSRKHSHASALAKARTRTHTLVYKYVHSRKDKHACSHKRSCMTSRARIRYMVLVMWILLGMLLAVLFGAFEQAYPSAHTMHLQHYPKGKIAQWGRSSFSSCHRCSRGGPSQSHVAVLNQASLHAVWPCQTTSDPTQPNLPITTITHAHAYPY